MPSFKNTSLAGALGALGLAVSILPAHADTGDYGAFGGRPGMTAVVADFVDYVTHDPRISVYFTNANLAVLRASLVNQFCMLEGGPCKFDENMKTIHQNMQITQAAFNALAEDLQKSMNKHDVPLTAQNDLLGKLAPMSHDIVTK